MSQAPFGMNWSAARHDARHAGGRHRHVRQPDACMDRKVIDALLGLFDQRVAEDLPREVLRFSAYFLECLINGYGADGDGGVADDPFTRFVDVLSCREVHDRIRPPTRRPDHLLYFFLNGGGDGRVPDVRVNLHQEIAADDHWLRFGMIDIGRDDGAASSDLVSHKLRRDRFWYRRTPALTLMLSHAAAMTVARGEFAGDFPRLVFADRD